MGQTGSCPIHWSPSLATDLYELTMAAGYFANDRRERATFELYVRNPPAKRSYLVAAGLSQAVDYLLALRFSADDIAHLKTLPPFRHIPGAFFDFLASFRFTGDLWAVPEGTVVFAGEPMIRITAPIIEAQIVETFLLATVNHQTLVATKAARIVEAARLATGIGPSLKGVRLDSGDLAGQAGRIRNILDEAGMTETRIMLSGDLNEYKIASLVASGVPADLFGVGNELVNSPDAPTLSGVYKLCELESPSGTRAVFKLSEGKETRPYAKQVWRRRDEKGGFVEDRVARNDEPAVSREWGPLLEPVMRDGALAGPRPDLSSVRQRASSQLASLPERYKRLEGATAYPVRFSSRISLNR